MNVTAKTIKSKLQNTAPPGVKITAPEPKTEVDTAIDVRFDEAGPEHGLTLMQKLGAAAMATLSGFTALAPQANAAPVEQLVTQSISESDGLEVTVLPRKTTRIDILRKTKTRRSLGTSSRTRESNVEYSNVGVHLGRGIFHDANGNLSLVPSLAAGWGDGITDFKRVDMDIPGYNDSVTRYGDTVHHKDGNYSRNVYVETPDGEMEIHRKGKMTDYQVLSNGVQYKGKDGLEWRITQDGNVLNVDGPGEDDYTLTYNANSIDLVGQEIANSIDTSDRNISVRGSGSDIDISRSESGNITEIQRKGKDYTIVRQGNRIRVEGTNSSFTVNPNDFIQEQSLSFTELSRMIEEAEPGYAEKHPLVMGLLEYATANPGLIGEDDAGNEVFLDVGKGLATGGGALKSGVALMKGKTALSLADNARALASSAAAAQAAAQSAAAGGNLAQAAAFGNEARNLAGQASALGAEAKSLGDSALKTQKVAKILTGVAGALEIADGVGDIHEGASSKDVVQGAIVITEALRERLSEELTGRDQERMMEDYSKVMQILDGLKQNANKQIRIGGIKIGCGGLMLISALAGGGVIPPIIGAVGMVCTVGTSVYENWDHLEAFFTGDEVRPDPTLRDVLPRVAQPEDIVDFDAIDR